MSGEEAKAVRLRKTRSDKKKDVKPTIAVNLKNCIYRLSYITNRPVKDIGEILCLKGLSSRKVIEHLSNFFIRDYECGSTFYIGEFNRESLQKKYQSKDNERITIRFNQDDYNEISRLAYALNVTPSKATSLLLDASIRNTNLLNSIVKLHLNEHLDNSRVKELKQVLKYVNNNNPYNEEISWFSLLSLIYDEVKESTSNVKRVINDWLENNK